MLEKIARRPFLLAACFTFLFFFILDYGFGITSFVARAGIAGGLAFLMSPRAKVIQTQDGEKKQITWFLLKNAIITDK